MADVGFGSNTNGHADAPGGSSTITVTNTNNSGAGSFRQAVADHNAKAANEGTEILFTGLSGTITLTSNLELNHSYFTIDGSGAADPGISVVLDPNVKLAIRTTGSAITDGIVRYLRVTGQGGHPGNSADAWVVDDSNGDTASRFIFDHLTLVASEDGCIDLRGQVDDVTISRCWIKDTSLSTLFFTSSAATGPLRDVTVWRNLFSKNGGRLPRMAGNVGNVDIVNNVMYRWGVAAPTGTDGTEFGSTNEGDPNWINIENNIFHWQDGDRGSPANAIRDYTSVGVANWYVNGNRFPPEETATGAGSQFTVPAYAAVDHTHQILMSSFVLSNAGTVFRTAGELADIATIAQDVGAYRSAKFGVLRRFWG